MAIYEAKRVLEELRSDRKPIEQALMSLMAKAGGEVIESDEHPPLRLVWGWAYDYGNQTGVRVPVLEFDRPDNRFRRRETK